ncbi:methyltransferase domain-containing protein [Nocardioides sp. P86]|uniref:methyltransferase domain-containing protein n=1 Tax=Nocardioides sp. P86 TaxID=2939569 RepID=UPI00203E7767|nr:methyltransferase domain-containing protein [Nocardioides sp. P86]MCM3513774.1 class I SAM-dependent methyltransferase [Nocardioides sp. P86]
MSAQPAPRRPSDADPSDAGRSGAGPTEADPLEPDTKDWTWVLDRACPDCGFDPREHGPAAAGPDLATALRADAAGWTALLRATTDPAPATRHPGASIPQGVVDPRVRTDPSRWSVLEYAAHVRDVHRVFRERLVAMVEETGPRFADWDQDAAAREGDYARLDPRTVGEELVAAADAVAAVYDTVAASPDPTVWERTGVRSNGSRFTVATLGVYHLHDVVHHTWDVRDVAAAVTVAAYDAQAPDYRAATDRLDEAFAPLLDEVAARAPGGQVLEIGSGGGRDALALEARGLRVRRTDVTPAFVAMLRAAGHAAELLDPLLDDLRPHPGEPGGADAAGPRAAAYDVVWANACLLHVARTDLPRVAARLAEVTRPGGLLVATLKEGEGEQWSVHGTIEAARRFVLWREPALVALLTGAGWQVERVGRRTGARDTPWLEVLARRR